MENVVGRGAHQLAARARADMRSLLAEMDRADLVDDASLVVSELVTNAVLHGGGCARIGVTTIPSGVRIEVEDRNPAPPVVGRPAIDAMTGRGMRLIASVANRWGATPTPERGKIVWAEVTGSSGVPSVDLSEDELLAQWGDGEMPLRDGPRYHVVLGEVPTDLLMAAKSHVDNLVREFALVDAGARHGLTAQVPAHLASLIDVVAHRFSEARDSIKRQALAAAKAGASRTLLQLDLDATAAEAGRDYLAALDALDAYCRAGRLLTLEAPPQHRVFRHWYVGELIDQLTVLASGRVPAPPQTFESRLLEEVDSVVSAQRAAERSARLFTVTGALSGAATPEAVAEAVLDDGVGALGASGGVMLIATEGSRLIVPGVVGYEEDVVARLRAESIDADLPAAVALRSGEAVWIESRAERDSRFPALADFEPATISMCAVPMEIGGRRLGALRFSFSAPRLFDEDERRFVLALAAQTAQALDRAQLQAARVDANRRLQRSLLPPSMPSIPGVEVATVYHPFGEGMEVGGDFYDLWRINGSAYAVAIGDVVGKGPEAAALTALVRYSLRALTRRDIDPATALVELNELLLSMADDHANSETFCTAIFGVAVPAPPRLKVTLASGGHPWPVIRRADGSSEDVRLDGSLVGAFPDAPMDVVEVDLGPGDTLAMFTDGVTDAVGPDGAMFDADGIHRVLVHAGGGAAEIAKSIEEAVVAHAAGELADDLALLVLQVAARSMP